MLDKSPIIFAWCLTGLWVATLIMSFINTRYKIPVAFDVMMPMVAAYIFGKQFAKVREINQLAEEEDG